MLRIPSWFMLQIENDGHSSGRTIFYLWGQSICPIAFHFVCEGVCKDEWCTTYLNTHYNLSDMLTKSLPAGEKRTRFTGFVLHYNY